MAESALPDLGRPRRVHIVAVGGSAMSAIAEILTVMGHAVTGSDKRDSGTLSRLAGLGMDVRVGNAPELAAAADLVAVSSAVPATDADVVAARAGGVPVWPRADVLSALCHLRRTIAVAGTHGKTTTTALVVAALQGGGLDPSYLVGAPLAATGSGARWSAGEWFVVEADESDGTFLRLPAEVAVVTSVEPDHLSYWGSAASLEAAFARFTRAAGRWSLVCAEDPGAAAAGAAGGSRTYGRSAGAWVRVVGEEAAGLGSRASVSVDGSPPWLSLEVPLPGGYNVLNATGALAVAVGVGADPARAAAGIGGFSGVARRFELRGQRGGVTFVDDYAHLPGEVAAVLGAAAAGAWHRVVCVFQPHRYTRTQALWADFAPSFAQADVLGVTEIYGADEAPIPGVSGRLVVDAVAGGTGPRPARVEWLPGRDDVVDWLRRELRPGDLCLTLGAGDLTTVADELGARL